MSVGARPRLAAGIGGVGLALVLALIAALSGAPASLARSLHPRPLPPVLGHVPVFQLVDGRGASFTGDSMLGHVSVVDFIFTRCPASCPRLTGRMAQLQEHFARSAADIHLVSFSVDPENDTPPVLAEYAARVHADPARWAFVTGPVNDVEKAVVLGFKVSAAKVAKSADDYDVIHGEWLVLVDRTGSIRGYYPVNEPQEFQTLIDDIVRLSDERS
jgi:protein SCO1/2